MKLGNIEVEFSFTNAQDIERFEKGAKKVAQMASSYQKRELSLSETITKECEVIEDFFDEVFGSGISKKIFGEKKDLKEHMELFSDVVNAKVAQTKDIQNLYDGLKDNFKYMPNRETRRHNKYKGRR